MLYCWCHPEDTVLLCNHVLQHGAGQWQLLAGHFPECPAATVIAPLKWHALQLQHEQGSSNAKRYSDWELCLLHLAHQLGAAQNEGKARVCKALSSWLPGRTAAAIKQAYAGCTDARVAQLLQQNGWPADMLALLEVWPGPGPQYQGRTADKDQHLAAHILAQIQAEEAAQLMPVTAVTPAWPVSSPAAAAAAVAASAFGAAAAAAAALGASVTQMQPAGVPAAPHLGPAFTSLLQPGCLEGMSGHWGPHLAVAEACCTAAAFNAEPAPAGPASLCGTQLQLDKVPQGQVGAEGCWGPPWDLASATAAAGGQEQVQEGWAASPQIQQQQQQQPVLPAPALAGAGAGAAVSTQGACGMAAPGHTAAGPGAAAAAGPTGAAAPAGSSGVLLPMQLLQASASQPATSLEPQPEVSCGLDLPEGDPALRQTLEQHLDSMLAGPGLDPVVEPSGQGSQPPAEATCPCAFEELIAQVALGGSGASPATAGVATTAAGVSEGSPAGFAPEGSAAAVSSTAAGGAASAAAAAAPVSSGVLLGAAHAPLGGAGAAAAAAAAGAHLQGSHALRGGLPGAGHKRPWQFTQLQPAASQPDSLGWDTGPGSLHYSAAAAMPGARRAGSEPGQQLSPASADSQMQQEQLVNSGGTHHRPVRRGVSAGALSCTATARAASAHFDDMSAAQPQPPGAFAGSAAAFGAGSADAGSTQQRSASATTQPPCSGLTGGLGAGLDVPAPAGVMQIYMAMASRQCSPGDACMQEGVHRQDQCGVVGSLQQQVEALQQRQSLVEAEVTSLKLLLQQLLPTRALAAQHTCRHDKVPGRGGGGGGGGDASWEGVQSIDR